MTTTAVSTPAPTAPSAFPASAAPDSEQAPAPVSLRAHDRTQAPAGGLRIVVALVRSTLLGFVREPVGFVMQFLYPLFMLFIFHAVFPGELLAGVSYAQYLLPAMVTTGIMTTCLQNLAVTVAGERENGELKRLAVLPAPSWAHVASKCASNTILALLNATMLILVGRWVLDIDLPGTARAWGLLAATIVLMVATCTALGLVIGRTRPTQRAASGLVTPIVLILQFVSGIFFPLAQLPTWMVNAFSVLPVRWSAELMREAFLPSTFAVAEPTGAWETGKGLVIVAAWLVVGVLAAIVITRRDTVDR